MMQDVISQNWRIGRLLVLFPNGSNRAQYKLILHQWLELDVAVMEDAGRHHHMMLMMRRR